MKLQMKIKKLKNCRNLKIMHYNKTNRSPQADIKLRNSKILIP